MACDMRRIYHPLADNARLAYRLRGFQYVVRMYHLTQGLHPVLEYVTPSGFDGGILTALQIRGKHGNSDTSANEMRTHKGVFLQTSPYKRGANIGATGVLPAYREMYYIGSATELHCVGH